ncbi:hypothetical protein A3Q56_08278 [Intoshia linei]|uniref:DDE-1 domain-containing protein n=1 Tax=Intoshia linei TaxID=1819745 RepID=A0A177APU9_9BILA|nr:hypothetical protein A3Q56_08278 [Intoshia linei]
MKILNNEFKREEKSSCGHKIEDFSNIAFIFIPSNTTSVIQPLDMGNNFIYLTVLNEDINLNNYIKLEDFKKILRWIEKSIEDMDSVV